MVDHMSAIASIFFEIDETQAALNTLRSYVLDFVKSEEPSVSKRKKRANQKQVNLQL